MTPMILPLSLLVLIAAVVLIGSYICFRIGYYVPSNRPGAGADIDLPEGEIYEPFHAKMIRWTEETRAMPREHVSIQSFDGLTLHGNYYEFAPGAPIELMFHGYRGCAERDLSGGVQRCFKMGRSALIVEQRCSRESEGNVITFGIYEQRDCLSWVAFMLRRFGQDVKIILTGISMGAATVLMASNKDLPANVIGIIADCSYNSPKEIIQLTIQKMGLPVFLCYPLARLGAILYGHFDPEADSPEEAVKTAKVPILFFHGETDDYVPCYMTQKVYDACTSRKMLYTVPGAGHGLSYPMDPEGYRSAANSFFGREAGLKKETLS